MQIKGNAGVFHYELMSDLANIILTFLEKLEAADQDAVDLVIACHQTLRLITAKQMRGKGGELGMTLSTELQAACDRYHKRREAS